MAASTTTTTTTTTVTTITTSSETKPTAPASTPIASYIRTLSDITGLDDANANASSWSAHISPADIARHWSRFEEVKKKYGPKLNTEEKVDQVLQSLEDYLQTTIVSLEREIATEEKKGAPTGSKKERLALYRAAHRALLTDENTEGYPSLFHWKRSKNGYGLQLMSESPLGKEIKITKPTYILAPDGLYYREPGQPPITAKQRIPVSQENIGELWAQLSGRSQPSNRAARDISAAEQSKITLITGHIPGKSTYRFSATINGFGAKSIGARELLAYYYLAAFDPEMEIPEETTKALNASRADILNLSRDQFIDTLGFCRREHSKPDDKVDKPSCPDGAFGRLLSKSSTYNKLTAEVPTVKWITETIHGFMFDELEKASTEDQALLFRYYHNKYILFGEENPADRERVIAIYATIQAKREALFHHLSQFHPRGKPGQTREQNQANIAKFKACAGGVLDHMVSELLAEMVNKDCIQKIMKVGAMAAIATDRGRLAHEICVQQTADWVELRHSLEASRRTATNDLMRALLFPGYLKFKDPEKDYDVAAIIKNTLGILPTQVGKLAELKARDTASSSSSLQNAIKLREEEWKSIAEMGSAEYKTSQAEVTALAAQFTDIIAHHKAKIMAQSDDNQELLSALDTLASRENKETPQEYHEAVCAQLSKFCAKMGCEADADYRYPTPVHWAQNFIRVALLNDERQIQRSLDFLGWYLNCIFPSDTEEQENQKQMTARYIATQLEVSAAPMPRILVAQKLLKAAFVERGVPLDFVPTITHLRPDNSEWQAHVLRELKELSSASFSSLDAMKKAKANLVYKKILGTFRHRLEKFDSVSEQDVSTLNLLCEYYMGVTTQILINRTKGV